MRTRLVLLLTGVLAAGGCKRCGSSSPSSSEPPKTTAAPADPARPRVPSATEPDPDYEARRDELLRRGDPEMMKPAPVIDTAKGADTPEMDLIKPVSKDVLMVGPIRVDLAQGRAEIPARIVLQEGVLEFVAIARGGKAHESLLEVEGGAVELRLALTLLGHEGVPPAADGSLPPSTAPTLRALVDLDRDGDRPPVDVTELLVDRQTGKRPAMMAWRVVGFDDAHKQAALQTRQLMSLVAHEPHAPLRAAGDLGNPYAGPDQGIAIAPGAPAVDTPVTLILTTAKEGAR